MQNGDAARKVVPFLKSTDGEITLADALDRWLVIRSAGWCPGVQGYARSIVHAWVGILPPRPVAEITSIHIEELFSLRKSPRRGPASMNRERKFLIAFWAWLLRHKIVSEDSTWSWPHLREVPTRAYHSVTPEEEARALEVLDPASSVKWDVRVTVAKRLALRRYIVMGIHTGLRKSVIYHAKWGWLTPDWILEIPAIFMKSRRAFRIPIPKIVREALGVPSRPEDPLIPDLPANHSLDREFKRIARLAGIDPKVFYPHQLRRTMVCRLLEKGVPESTIQKLGQWHQLSVMQKHYTCGLRDEEARKILEKI